MAEHAIRHDVVIGQILAHYRIIEKIGAGGMGEVYRAYDEHLDREVAIKVLPPGTLSDEHSRKRFRREALALSKLSHPNIATVHDFDMQQGVDFLVMEYIPGITLSEKLAARPLPEKEVVALGTQLAEGLSAAHEHGVVHRDLKPGNLRLTGDGRLKILDFGLAKLRHPVTESVATESFSETQAMAGTLPYMAPEQLLGGEIDARTDIHAAGSVLYETATGKRPFADVEGPQLIGAILRKPPPPPTVLNPRLSPELERIIAKCLEKEPEDRYQSAKELAIDLRRLQAGVVSRLQPMKRPAKWLSAKSVGLSLVILAAVIVLLFSFNVGGWRQRLLAGTGGQRIESLAVLPLENLSGDKEQEYFADGMTEELIATLGRVGALRVISRTSVMQYKGVRKPLPQIARELGVDAVVEGSVLRVGNRVRVTAQLIQASSDKHLWAETYDRDLRDVLALQSEVAEAISREIGAVVTPEERARLARAQPVNPEAYEAYLRGRFFWNKRTEEGYRKGIEFFGQALEKDPSYALAYTGLADCYSQLAEYGFVPPEEGYGRAGDLAKKALDFDETLAEAHTSLAEVKFEYEWDWLGAEKEFKRAIALNPNYATAHHWYSDYLGEMGRHEEALAEAKRAEQLDPLSPIISTIVGIRFLWMQRYDEAVEQLQKTLQIDPNFAVAHAWLGQTYAQMGRYESAIAEYQKARAASGGPNLVAALGQVYAAAGKREQALKILGQLKEMSMRTHVNPLWMAQIYAALGEKDQALEWLEKGYAVRAQGMYGLKVDPVFDRLRSDPGFQELLRRMNFPH